MQAQLPQFLEMWQQDGQEQLAQALGEPWQAMPKTGRRGEEVRGDVSHGEKKGKEIIDICSLGRSAVIKCGP